MPHMTIITQGDNCWPDLKERMRTEMPAPVVHIKSPIQVARLPGGMASGKSSVMFRFELVDGTTVLAETSLELFASAARALMVADGAA